MRDVSKDRIIHTDCAHDQTATRSYRLPWGTREGVQMGYALECKEQCGAEDLWLDHDWKRDGDAEFTNHFIKRAKASA